jgi:hypothetical protein
LVTWSLIARASESRLILPDPVTISTAATGEATSVKVPARVMPSLSKRTCTSRGSAPGDGVAGDAGTRAVTPPAG